MLEVTSKFYTKEQIPKLTFIQISILRQKNNVEKWIPNSIKKMDVNYLSYHSNSVTSINTSYFPRSLSNFEVQDNCVVNKLHKHLQ
jgi:hypothetical protein